MTVLVIYSTTNDGYVQSSSGAAYLTARSGGTKSADSAANFLSVGQTDNGFGAGPWVCWEGFVGFDTSPIGAGGTVTAATLSIVGFANNNPDPQTIVTEAWLKDWGAGVDTGDWVAGASVSGLTKLATQATSTSFSTAGYNDFTSTGSMVSNINKTGFTRMLLATDRFTAGTTPSTTGSEYYDWKSADTAGTTSDPKLTVTYTPAPSGGTLPMMGI